MFTIQEGPTDVMVWCKASDGRRVCVHVCDSRLAARLWVSDAIAKLAIRGIQYV